MPAPHFKLTTEGLPAAQSLIVDQSMSADKIPNFRAACPLCGASDPWRGRSFVLPGEDLFYYTTGRQPRVPVLMFDHTVNPYTADEVLKIGRDLKVRWLIVKHELQLDDDVVDGDKAHLTKLLKQDFKLIKGLKGYDVYQRRHT
jgi:hypothetical protein